MDEGIKMNSREKFLETMNFNTGATANKWEFGIWGKINFKLYFLVVPLDQRLFLK